MQNSKNILVATSQVPFSRGGAEALTDRLVIEIKKKGHRVDVVSLPFIARSSEDLIGLCAQWRSLDLSVVSGRKVDLVIATKFPAYFLSHPNKVVWLIHQHRQAYDLLGTRFGDFKENNFGESVRCALTNADIKVLSEAVAIFAISGNVSARLQEFCGINSEVLEPPLPIQIKVKEDAATNSSKFILVVGRLCSSKRVELIVRALPRVEQSTKLIIVGLEDEPNYKEFLDSEVEKHHLQDRVVFLGQVGAMKLAELYASCFCVFYGPFDEDYGFVSYEAASYGKPLVTTTDGGYVTEVANKHGFGIICEPTEKEIAEGINILIKEKAVYAKLAQAALNLTVNDDWDGVVEKLTAFG